VAIGKMNSVINELNGLDYVEQLDSVTGPCDIIIKLNANDYHQLKEVVLNKIHNIDGIMGCSTSLVVEL
jgi:DNA-binding Lrp family transcriptional regulator